MQYIPIDHDENVFLIEFSYTHTQLNRKCTESAILAGTDLLDVKNGLKQLFEIEEHKINLEIKSIVELTPKTNH